MPTTPATPPKAPDTPPKAPDTPPAGKQAEQDNPLSAAVESLLTIAEGLHKDKADVLGRIGANRDTLRNLAKQGAATPEQAERIEKVYPARKAKDDEQNGAGS